MAAVSIIDSTAKRASIVYIMDSNSCIVDWHPIVNRYVVSGFSIEIHSS